MKIPVYAAWLPDGFSHAVMVTVLVFRLRRGYGWPGCITADLCGAIVVFKSRKDGSAWTSDSDNSGLSISAIARGVDVIVESAECGFVEAPKCKGAVAGDGLFVDGRGNGEE